MRKLTTVLLVAATLAALVFLVDFICRAHKAESSLRSTGVSDAVPR